MKYQLCIHIQEERAVIVTAKECEESAVFAPLGDPVEAASWIAAKAMLGAGLTELQEELAAEGADVERILARERWYACYSKEERVEPAVLTHKQIFPEADRVRNRSGWNGTTNRKRVHIRD